MERVQGRGTGCVSGAVAGQGGHVLREAETESARVEEIEWCAAKKGFDAVTLKSWPELTMDLITHACCHDACCPGSDNCHYHFHNTVSRVPGADICYLDENQFGIAQVLLIRYYFRGVFMLLPYFITANPIIDLSFLRVALIIQLGSCVATNLYLFVRIKN